MNYNLLPQNLDEYENCNFIENIKKIDENHNLIIYGKSGYGKTHLKEILIKKYKENNKFLKIINLNLEDDLKKTSDTSDYMLNLLKISQKKLFVIDNVDKIDINHQIFIKSLIKNYKNFNFIIFLNDISTLIENFYSLFIILKLDNDFFILNKKKIIEIMKKEYKLSKTYYDFLNKSNNFYTLKKNCSFFILFKEKSSKFISQYKSITTNNNNKILINILNNNLNDNITYINQLLDKGYSENNIVNFIINSLKDEKINIKNRNTIINIILKLELDRLNYTYIDLLYLIKNLSIVDNKMD